jgi:hypothetical protein
MTGKPKEGWYVSPENKEMLRWWDGTQWTQNEKPNPASNPSMTAPQGKPVERAPKTNVSAAKVTNVIGASGLAAAGAALAADGAVGLGKKRKGFNGIGKYLIIGSLFMVLGMVTFFAGVADALDGKDRITAMGTVTKLQTDEFDDCIPTAEFTANGTKVAVKGEDFVECTWQLGDPIQVSFDEGTAGLNPEIGEAVTPGGTMGGALVMGIFGLFIASIGLVKLAVRAGSVAGGFLLFRQGMKLGAKTEE